MKKYFSKEVKIAISVIVSAVILYFGIEFLKGINLMHPSIIIISDMTMWQGLLYLHLLRSMDLKWGLCVA